MVISKQTQALIQEARQLIIIDDLSSIDKRYHKILEYNPNDVFELLKDKINPFKRKNNISTANVFKNIPKKVCACGCGKKLEGRRTRWATDSCSSFPFLVISIINGDTSLIRPIIAEIYGGYKCFKCNRTDDDFERILDLPKGGWRRGMTKEEQKAYDKQYNQAIHDMHTKIHLDHILPVHKGGGGCWLSNFQLICEQCHKIKSREERKG